MRSIIPFSLYSLLRALCAWSGSLKKGDSQPGIRMSRPD